jgi:hypothetical protein
MVDGLNHGGNGQWPKVEYRQGPSGPLRRFCDPLRFQ